MADNPILEADSIGKSFGDRRILSSASLSAAPGQVVGILGRMGEGKSTLLKICSGVTSTDTGWVKYKERIRNPAKLASLAPEGVYYLPEAGSLSGALTLREHFELFRTRFKLDSFDDLIEDFELGTFLGSSPSLMSTGERRRTELALVCYRRPECLLADEPFRDLDPIVGERVGRVLKALAEGGCAIVLTGHEIRTLTPFLTSVVWLTSGTTYSLGNPSDAWKNDYFRKEYLGPSGERIYA
ncbi:MAG TPA: ATP-binding cassette domain-containing protein [Gemmatimonadaceae bacterium]|nr:ATP-binding cassette domain-containing protein [Gemmatimonadaceae bacterium]